MQSFTPHVSNFFGGRKFFQSKTTRFLLLALILLGFFGGFYFAPALFSRRQTPSRASAGTQPTASGIAGEHSAISQVSPGASVKAPADGVVDARLREMYGRLPIAFEDNAGQHDDKVKYSARGSGFQLFLTSDEAVLALSKPSARKERRGHDSRVDQDAAEQSHATGSGAVLRMKLVGANRRASVKGEDELAAKSNYFVGAKPEDWHTGVAMFEKVRYREVYPGIDVVYYGNQRQLEYDFVLAPHADPARIKFKFSGAHDMHLDAEGHLLLQTVGGYVRQEKPLIYQLVDGRRQEIAGRYALKESGEIGFQVGRYDRSQPLVIDPVLSYSTYLGGTGSDRAFGIALDAQGNAYITGETDSTDFPTQNAFHGSIYGTDDAFVLKLHPSGTALVYATYLGGESFDSGYGIAVDAAGCAYVTGTTFSENFPLTSGAVQSFNEGHFDGFITKLNAEGNSVVYSGYLGGENVDSGYSVGVDAAGNAYVTGETESSTFTGVAMPKLGSPVYKSGDSGASWSARRNGLPSPNIAGLTVDPTNSNILYAADQFGVFKSLNGGASWSQTGLHSSEFSIWTTSVVVDPSTPTTIYASAFGSVHKSINGGGSWSSGNIRMDNGGGSYTTGHVSCVALDPNNLSTLYACAFDGVYKSVNGGTTWAKSSGGFAQSVIRVNKIVLDPSNSQILYAATPSGIYKSTDGAATWATVNNGLLSASGTTPSVASLAISPATIYAGTSAGLFKSTDGGLNWVAANDGLLAQLPNGDFFIPSISSIAISPAEATTIYAGSPQGGVFKSTDGGAHWAASNNGLANINVTSLAVAHTAAATLYVSAASLSDGFVVKLDATGTSLGYLRYLGGHEDDSGGFIAVDPSGNAYVTGNTRSTNFPTLNPAQANGGVFYDAFVTKLGSDGSNVYSTYLGGTGSDQGIGIAVNSAGNAYVTGRTNSINFPTAGTRQTSNSSGTEIFVSKLSVSGSSLDYSIYHGGNSNDHGFAIALDASGNAYVTGSTASSDFPVTNGLQAAYGGGTDAFVLKLSPTSEVIYSTYLGGSGSDQGFCIAVDSDESVYLAGPTNSTNFPTASPLQASRAGGNDAFITKISNFPIPPSVIDLSMTMTDAPDPVVLGGDLTYTINVANLRELAATGVRLSDTLPAGSVFVSATPSAGTCSGTNTVICDLGTIVGGANATVTIVIKPPAVGSITNTARVIANEPEVSTSNNTASQSTQVHFADLKVTKTLSHDLVRAGAKLVYFLKVTNLGGVTTGAVTLTDNLPAGLTFASCSSTGRFVCGGSGNNRVATLPSLAVGASESITLTALVDGSVANGALISNTASVSSNLSDPNTADNQSTAIATVTDTPIQPRSNGKIAYGNTRGEVKAVNANGSEKMTYTDRGNAGSPAWSPDGSKIAFCAHGHFQRNVHVMNADGTGLKTINVVVGLETNITWSPRGTHLAVIGNDGSIYLAQADGTDVTKLINNSQLIRSLDWSPDGQKFAFHRDNAIYLMDIDGSNTSRLTGDSANPSYWPRWSPDGSKILFQRFGSTYIINADGTGETALFNQNAQQASWSPDGTKVVFVHRQDLLFPETITTINLDGSGRTEVTNDSDGSFSVGVSEPDWQPVSNASPTPTPPPAPTYKISGRVTLNTVALSGVSVALGGGRTSVTTTDANGDYAFNGLTSSYYTVTPSKSGYNFTPPNRAFRGLASDHTANFAAASDAPASRTNVALAVHGARVEASSVHSAGYAPTAINDGDRRGANWGAGGGWNDATFGQYPDWVEVDFYRVRAIDEVDIFTIQDNYANPGEPTAEMTFTQYGVTDFEVLYWNGGGWAAIPGASVTANGKVWRKFTFAPVATTRIKVVVTGALNGYSRLAEVEAWQQETPTPTPTPSPRTNVALASQGATVAASSAYSGEYAATAVNNGDRRGTGWGSGGGWNDATQGQYPDWVEVSFAGAKTIDEVDVFAIQDDYANPAEPTAEMTFTKYGITHFAVQYWDGAAWLAIPNATVVANNLVWNKLTFPPLTTTKIRVLITNSLQGYSRLAEVEAWQPSTGGTTPSRPNLALAANGATVVASSEYSSAYPVAAINNGDRRGIGWGSGGGWNDATLNEQPDWVEVRFSGAKTLSEVNVFSVQDNYANPSEPSAEMTFTKYGVTDFAVQYWDGANWVAIPGASVAANNMVWRKLTFSPVTTERIRVLVTGALGSYSRLTEVEAYQ